MNTALVTYFTRSSSIVLFSPDDPDSIPIPIALVVKDLLGDWFGWAGVHGSGFARGRIVLETTEFSSSLTSSRIRISSADDSPLQSERLCSHLQYTRIRIRSADDSPPHYERLCLCNLPLCNSFALRLRNSNAFAIHSPLQASRNSPLQASRPLQFPPSFLCESGGVSY